MSTIIAGSWAKAKSSNSTPSDNPLEQFYQKTSKVMTVKKDDDSGKKLEYIRQYLREEFEALRLYLVY